MNPLITATIGLYYSTTTKQHYLQVISAEEQNHYFFKITSEEADKISKKDNLEIVKTTDSF